MKSHQSDQQEKIKEIKMSSASADLAVGKKFLQKLLYVQDVSTEVDTVSEIPELFLQYFGHQDDDRKVYDLNFTQYLKSSKSNVQILKPLLQDIVRWVWVYSNPLTSSVPSSSVAIHAFVIFRTENSTDGSRTWWSLEKNGIYIILRQSSPKQPTESNVLNQFTDSEGSEMIQYVYDVHKKSLVLRLEPTKALASAAGNHAALSTLLVALWDTSQVSTPYNLLTANCQNFASFVFERANGEGKTWSTLTSGLVDRFKHTIQKAAGSAFDPDAIKYSHILNCGQMDCYKAIIDNDFAEFTRLVEKLTMTDINSADSQGYTLLEWVQAFSRKDMENYLTEEKNATSNNSSDQNVRYITLQYLNSNEEFDFSGITINGSGVVNPTNGTVLHLALYGEKWAVVEKILDEWDGDINTTNSLGETPLHLATKLKCRNQLFNKLLSKANSEIGVDLVDVYGLTPLHWALSERSPSKSTVKMLLEKSANLNQTDSNGNTPLHYILSSEFKSIAKMLLKHIKNKNIENSLDVNSVGAGGMTALHYAANWPSIPVELFEFILKKSNDVNATTVLNSTALHLALAKKSETAIQLLLKHDAVDVNIKGNSGEIALHYIACWSDFSDGIFTRILQKTTDVNATDNHGNTALQFALLRKSKKATKILLSYLENREDGNREAVNVNIANEINLTALHCACRWPNIPVDLFNLILDKTSRDNEHNRTALFVALNSKSKIATKKLLRESDNFVDVRIRNRSNQTQLHIAASWPEIPVDLLDFIIDKFIDVVNERDVDGKTALDIALDFKSKNAESRLRRAQQM